MKHLNAIIIGVSIIISSIVIALNLPRYQFSCSKTEHVDKDGNITVDIDYFILDMISARLYNKNINYSTTGKGGLLYSGHSIGRIPTCSSLKLWEKQREVFGGRIFTVDEWNKWKKANGWD